MLDKLTLNWVIDELLPYIKDMGGDNGRRIWWNKAAGTLEEALEIYLEEGAEAFKRKYGPFISLPEHGWKLEI